VCQKGVSYHLLSVGPKPASAGWRPKAIQRADGNSWRRFSAAWPAPRGLMNQQTSGEQTRVERKGFGLAEGDCFEVRMRWV